MPLKIDSCPTVSYVTSTPSIFGRADIVVPYNYLDKAACSISKMKLPLIREDNLHWNLSLREREYLGFGGLIHCYAIPINSQVPSAITLFHPTKDGLIAMVDALSLPLPRL